MDTKQVQTLQYAEDKVDQLEKALADFKERMKDLLDDLKEEREGGIPSEATLKAKIDDTQAMLNQTSADIQAEKERIKVIKGEIKGWKQWFENEPVADNPANVPLLNKEIDWRAAEIKEREARIQDLLKKELALRDAIELAQQKLLALQNGVFNVPFEEDPRVVAIHNQHDELTATLTLEKQRLVNLRKRYSTSARGSMISPDSLESSL